MASRMSRSSHGGKPFSANRTRTETAGKTTADGQKYPEIKQRGFYSDIIGVEANVTVSSLLMLYAILNCICIYRLTSHVHIKYTYTCLSICI